MNRIRSINKVILAIQIGLFGMGLINIGFFFGAIMFAIITGATQISLAFALIGINQRANQAALYLTLVSMYFGGLYFLFDGLSEPINMVYSFGSPIALAIYISYIIHNKEVS